MIDEADALSIERHKRVLVTCDFIISITITVLRSQHHYETSRLTMTSDCFCSIRIVIRGHTTVLLLAA
jgi:hypothetical protein